MEPQEFVTAVRARVIANDNEVYQKLLTSANGATDPVWQDVIKIYRDLGSDQQALFVSFLRLIQVNTVSHIFGILDGSTYLSDESESFILKTENGDDLLNGDLQEIFLELEEEE